MSVIRNGKYIKDGKPAEASVSEGLKSYNLDMQRRDHAKDILQRFKGGKVNPEFVRAYPEESKQYFSEQEIREAGNNYDG